MTLADRLMALVEAIRPAVKSGIDDGCEFESGLDFETEVSTIADRIALLEMHDDLLNAAERKIELLEQFAEDVPGSQDLFEEIEAIDRELTLAANERAVSLWTKDKP